MGKKTDHFSFRLNHPVLTDYLNSMPKGERSEYIRQAIINYNNLFIKLENIENKLDIIFNILQQKTHIKIDHQDQIQEPGALSDKLVAASLQDLLEL